MSSESIQNLTFQRSTLNSIPGSIRPLDGTSAPMATMAANNPFLITQNPITANNRTVGVNKPFYKPMFLGYRDDQTLYGGARLFVLA
jgi:hypothetical protein